ncbi:MAG: SUMF1/EgtB/PvdO family nonheme iron enzyme [Beijerinckiaceae bacterium]
MSSLADLSELVGFFSYSRQDDKHSLEALSKLRSRIQSELRLQLGREFRLWQDVAAIPSGTLWEDEIKRAIAESVFFIPIITPSVVESVHCKFEFQSFLAREKSLGRSDLVFPILYVRVPALEKEAEWRHNDVLEAIGRRQYVDWRHLRHEDVTSREVKKNIEHFCENIVEALCKPWAPPAVAQKKTEPPREAGPIMRVTESEPRNESERQDSAHADGLPRPAEPDTAAVDDGASAGSLRRRRRNAKSVSLSSATSTSSSPAPEPEVGARGREDPTQKTQVIESPVAPKPVKPFPFRLAAAIVGAIVIVGLGIGSWVITAHHEPVPIPAIAAGRLTVTDIPEFTGPERGPFSPSQATFNLRAIGTGFDWSIEGAGPGWLTLAPRQGHLADNGAIDVAVTPTSASQSLSPGQYESQIIFKNLSSGVTTARNVRLVVSPRQIVSRPCGGVVLASLSSRSAATLSAQEECALKPKDEFKECATCPPMVVVPSGSFTMGSPAGEPGRYDDEGPQHQVTIAKAFAVGKFQVTRDEFAAFVNETGYDTGSKCGVWSGKWEEKEGFSWRNPGYAQTGTHPVACLNWNDAKAYLAWLAKKTGKTYRLLSESEWEYAARAGTTTVYPWGDEIGKNNADCHDCGSQWDGKGTAPLGSFAPNKFGLYDMADNVFQWVEDCAHKNYDGAPPDGSSWPTEDCKYRVVRGGSWGSTPQYLRSASRLWYTTVVRNLNLGFRVGRTLTP